MTQPIERLVTYNLPDTHTNARLRNVIETHRHWLRTHEKTKRIQLTEELVQPYKYNLNLFLFDRGIPVELHWPTLLINDIDDPSEFTAELDVLLIPDTEAISNIAQVAR